MNFIVMPPRARCPCHVWGFTRWAGGDFVAWASSPWRRDNTEEDSAHHELHRDAATGKMPVPRFQNAKEFWNLISLGFIFMKISYFCFVPLTTGVNSLRNEMELSCPVK